MANVSAKDVMDLRKITGCGLMECKKALAEANGDIELAQQKMKEAGVLKAAKKSSRAALEGVIVVVSNQTNTHSVMLEVNCETDFVGKDNNFLTFVNSIANHALENNLLNITDLSNSQIHADKTVEALRQELVLKIGENIQIRKLVNVKSKETGRVGSYVHGGRLAALVVLDVSDDVLAKDIAMHVTATRPKSISEADFPKQELADERATYLAQAAESGKPLEIQEKMVDGRMKKYLAEHSLLEQAFVKDNDVKVSELLKNAKVESMHCFALGEAQ